MKKNNITITRIFLLTPISNFTFSPWPLLAILSLLFQTGCAWFPSAQEPPYVLVKTWGNKGDAPGRFNEPTGIAVSNIEVFVSDSRNHRIQVFDHNGQYQRQFGSTELERPMNISIAKGKLYVADFFADQIKVFSLDGKYLHSIGKSGAGKGEFKAPGGVAIAGNSDLFVADFYNQRVQQLRADGSFVRQWGMTGEAGVFSGKLSYPTDTAMAPNGILYIADGYNDRVLAIDPNGKLIHQWGGPFAMNINGSFNGWFATVTGITVGSQGNVYVADFYNDRVQKFTPQGEFLNAFGIPSDGPTHTAIAVAVAKDGNTFVADYANHQIQKWRPGE